jgi:hypothetical protein
MWSAPLPPHPVRPNLISTQAHIIITACTHYHVYKVYFVNRWRRRLPESNLLGAHRS